MTPVTRRLIRESTASLFSLGKTREVIVELAPPGDRIEFRLKGQRQTFWLPIRECYWIAVKAHTEAVREARKAARKSKKGKR